MIHNETANIWTHLVGLAIFVAITTSMVFGWGAAPMEALPATWITGGAFIWGTLSAQSCLVYSRRWT